MFPNLRSQPSAPPDTGWRARFTLSTPGGFEFARRDPRRGLVCANLSGSLEQYAWNVITGGLRQLTDRAFGTPFAMISPDGRHVFHVADELGSGVGAWIRIPWDEGEPDSLFPDNPVGAWSGAAISRDGTRFAASLARGAGSEIHVVEIDQNGQHSGSARVIALAGEDWSVRALSADGRSLVLASETAVSAQQPATLVVDTDTGKRGLVTTDGSPPGVALFSPRDGDPRLLIIAFRDGRRVPILFDIGVGLPVELGLDSLPGDVHVFDWSADGERILMSTTENAVQHLYIHNLARGETTPLPRYSGTFGAWGSSVCFGARDEVVAIWQDSTHPPEVVALNTASGARRTVLAAGAAPASRPWRSIEFASSDGRPVRAWLVEPRGSRPFPTVVYAHGGPDGAITEIFSPESQAWVDAGFAFVTVNYRGSTTFGREFEEKILGDPRRWEVEDLVAARAWLVGEGITVAEEVVVVGGSYGGYLALLAAGLRPELWAGAMAIAPIADWLVQAEDANETMRPWTTVLFGGDVAERRHQYLASSPITHAAQVSAPILLVHGRHDTIVPPRQAEVYAARLRDLGKPIELVWFDGGHLTFSDPELLVEHQALMLEFASRVVGRSEDRRSPA